MFYCLYLVSAEFNKSNELILTPVYLSRHYFISFFISLLNTFKMYIYNLNLNYQYRFYVTIFLSQSKILIFFNHKRYDLWFSERKIDYEFQYYSYKSVNINIFQVIVAFLISIQFINLLFFECTNVIFHYFLIIL